LLSDALVKLPAAKLKGANRILKLTGALLAQLPFFALKLHQFLNLLKRFLCIRLNVHSVDQTLLQAKHSVADPDQLLRKVSLRTSG
jgi:hypothetical protein